MNINEIKTWTWVASLALMIVPPGIGSCWAASPEVQPAEPIQLRGLPRPNDLPLAQGPFQPTQASLDESYRCPDWFADAKFGFWAHWGPQSVGMDGWYAKRMYDSTLPVYQKHINRFGHPSKVGYKDTIPLFTAEKFDPDALMAEFKEMGGRLFLAMGVHCDNYDMWNSNKMSGKAKAVVNEPFRIVITLNGRQPVEGQNLTLSADGKLATLEISRPGNETVEWSVNFK